MIRQFIEKLSYEVLETLFPEEYNIDQLSYDDFIAYYVQARPNNIAAKGAVIIRRLPRSYKIIQIFLDKSSNPIYATDDRIYGRKINVKQIDNELKEFFGTEKTIIIE